MEQTTKPGLVGRIRTYYDEVITEGRKVTWPSRDDVRGVTVVCFTMVILAAIVLGGVDYIIGLIVEFLFT